MDKFLIAMSSLYHVAPRRLKTLCASALFGAAWGAVSLTAAAHTLEPGTTASVEPAESVVKATAALPATVPGCGRQGRVSTGEFNWQTRDGNKKTRTFLLQVPADYDSSKSYALTFVFHGAGGNSAQSYSWGLQNATGASEGSIFVFPDGINYQNYGVGWDDTSKGYDIPFFDNMVKDIETYYCIAPTRVFAAGFSWGGDFVTSLVCSRGNVLRAAAANSTNDEYTDANNFMTYQNLPCSSTVHPAVRFVHAAGGDSEYPAPYFSDTSKLFQHLSSCPGTATPVTSSTPTMSCQSYNSCANAVVECAFNASIGHALPPNWASDTWAFFSSFK